jgi:hypothetical protein
VNPVRSLELEPERKTDASEGMAPCMLEMAVRMTDSADDEPPLAGRELQDETTALPVLVPAHVGIEVPI